MGRPSHSQISPRQESGWFQRLNRTLLVEGRAVVSSLPWSSPTLCKHSDLGPREFGCKDSSPIILEVMCLIHLMESKKDTLQWLHRPQLLQVHQVTCLKGGVLASLEGKTGFKQHLSQHILEGVCGSPVGSTQLRTNFGRPCVSFYGRGICVTCALSGIKILRTLMYSSKTGWTETVVRKLPCCRRCYPSRHSTTQQFCRVRQRISIIHDDFSGAVSSKPSACVCVQ